MTNRSAGAGRDGSRLLELAKEAAKHNHDRYFNVLHDRHGHVFESNNDETADGVWGFNTCPHPDCVLVRLAVPDPLASDTGQGEQHFHRFKYQIAIRAMVCRCGFRINEDDGYGFSELDRLSAPLASSSETQGENKNETTTS